MNLLTIIYLIGALAVGFFLGIVFEYFIDVQMIRVSQEECRRLRLKLAQAKKVQRVEHIETIEIVDNRTSNPDDLFKPF